MAGEWIKMRVDLSDDPAVIGMACRLDCSEYEVVGRLHKLWSWADRHTEDGHAPSVTPAWLDRYVERDGFADALIAAGWLVVDDAGLTIPNFERHNGQSAKKRGLAAERKRKQRDSVTHESREESRTERDVCVTREEKRRSNTPIPPKGGEYTAEFESFWRSYPNAKSKAAAFKVWQRLSAEDRAQAVEDVSARADGDPDWKRDGGRYVPMASTYLNGRRWEDERRESVRPRLVV